FGVTPGDKTAVHPNEAVTVVKGEQIASHEHFLPPRDFAKLYIATNAALYRSLQNKSIWLT
ncbi:MAG TPA: hypothetical protein VMI30_07135, partial [Stellaceae bacterium]|nr:hypothetical protein [Stellaceae bacterium]